MDSSASRIADHFSLLLLQNGPLRADVTDDPVAAGDGDPVEDNTDLPVVPAHSAKFYTGDRPGYVFQSDLARSCEAAFLQQALGLPLPEGSDRARGDAVGGENGAAGAAAGVDPAAAVVGDSVGDNTVFPVVPARSAKFDPGNGPGFVLRTFLANGCEAAPLVDCVGVDEKNPSAACRATSDDAVEMFAFGDLCDAGVPCANGSNHRGPVMEAVRASGDEDEKFAFANPDSGANSGDAGDLCATGGSLRGPTGAPLLVNVSNVVKIGRGRSGASAPIASDPRVAIEVWIARSSEKELTGLLGSACQCLHKAWEAC